MNQEYLLRSMLYVPAYNKRLLDSALKCNADALIIDLEDSVPDKFKHQARVYTKEYIERRAFANRNVFIRINPIESKMVFADLKYSLHQDVTGYMLTKIYTAEDMLYYDKLFSQYESEYGFQDGQFKFAPLLETTSAVMEAYSIAKATKRTIAVCFGGEDFLNDLIGLHGEPPTAFDYPRATIALAARAAGVLPIDTPFLKLDNPDGFIKESTLSFEMGFSGIQLIHPKQISLANGCFSPSQLEVEHSQDIIKACREAEACGTGVAMIDGQMVGPPMRKRAEKVLEIMEMIEQS